MLDAVARRALAPALHVGGRGLHRRGISADAVTAVGFATGVACCVAIAFGAWLPALALWLANRALDGLDGAVARIQGPTPWGGFADIIADFAVYGGFVLALAVALPDARLACAALLCAYYLNGAALLAFDAAAQRVGADDVTDERSLRFLGGLTEGSETILVHSLLLLLPRWAAPIAWTFAALVAVTAAWRVIHGIRALRRASHA